MTVNVVELQKYNGVKGLKNDGIYLHLNVTKIYCVLHCLFWDPTVALTTVQHTSILQHVVVSAASPIKKEQHAQMEAIKEEKIYTIRCQQEAGVIHR